MQMQADTTKTASYGEALESAARESDAAYALKHLGDMLRLSQEHAGFEGMSDKHWTAIGIAIEQLSERLYTGSLSKTLETISCAEEA